MLPCAESKLFKKQALWFKILLELKKSPDQVLHVDISLTNSVQLATLGQNLTEQNNVGWLFGWLVGSPYHMIIHALQTGTSFELEIFVWCTITAYTITYSEYFMYKWSTRLQSTHNHMVGRTASVIYPFHSLLPE